MDSQSDNWQKGEALQRHHGVGADLDRGQTPSDGPALQSMAAPELDPGDPCVQVHLARLSPIMLPRK